MPGTERPLDWLRCRLRDKGCQLNSAEVEQQIFAGVRPPTGVHDCLAEAARRISPASNLLLRKQRRYGNDPRGISDSENAAVEPNPTPRFRKFFQVSLISSGCSLNSDLEV